MSQRQAASSSRPRYDAIRDRIGEDPARYLAVDLDPRPRKRGIVDVGVVNGWLQVARDLGDQRAVGWLERRRQYLLQEQREG